MNSSIVMRLSSSFCGDAGFSSSTSAIGAGETGFSTTVGGSGETGFSTSTVLGVSGSEEVNEREEGGLFVGEGRGGRVVVSEEGEVAIGEPATASDKEAGEEGCCFGGIDAIFAGGSATGVSGGGGGGA